MESNPSSKVIGACALKQDASYAKILDHNTFVNAIEIITEGVEHLPNNECRSQLNCDHNDKNVLPTKERYSVKAQTYINTSCSISSIARKRGAISYYTGLENREET